MVVCPLVSLRLAIVLSVLLLFTDFDYPFGFFKLFLTPTHWYSPGVLRFQDYPMPGVSLAITDSDIYINYHFTSYAERLRVRVGSYRSLLITIGLAPLTWMRVLYICPRVSPNNYESWYRRNKMKKIQQNNNR